VTAMMKIGPIFLAAYLFVWAVPAIRADAIDDALAKKGKQLMIELPKLGFKNVGVLKFEVQRGAKGPVLMQVGRLNGAMAVRLENLLILASDAEQPKIGIVCGAGDLIAAKDKKATYQTPIGRADLFKLDLDYSLAWGKKKVKIDGFLTGRVQFSQNMETATVHLKAFHRDSPDNLIDIIKPFDTKTTTSLLSDMDLNFATRDAVKPKRFDPKEDDEPPVKSALKSILPQEPLSSVAAPNPGLPMPPAANPKLVPPLFARDVIEFEVLYDGQKVPRVNNRIPTPFAGQKVHFEMKNKTKDRIGLVVRINGVNTVNGDSDDKEARYHACWVLDPDVAYTVRGIYKWNAEKNQMERLPLTAQDMTPEDSALGLFVASKAGKIEVDLMVQRKQAADPGGDSLSQSVTGDSAKPDTLAQLKKLVQDKQSNPVPRAMIAPDFGNAEKRDLEKAQFVGSHEGHVTITYFERPKETGK
jgi:hypothetical protein